MKFKLIIALVTDGLTERVTAAARDHGATGCTVISSARGEGLTPAVTMLGLKLEAHCDVCLFLVEEHRSRGILEAVAAEGRFDDDPGSGIAFAVDIEDAVGLASQLGTIEEKIGSEL